MAQQLRERMNKWDSMKLKSFYTAKKTITRLKKLPPELDKNFSSYAFNKRLISRIYRELKIFNPQRINIPLNKWPHELNRDFSREEIILP
jgi:hypothetical protein